MKPLVSIVIPAYNSEKTIARTIDSVSAQSYQNIEILIINDGSTDRTSEIAKEYAKNDSRIIVFDKENTGLEDTRHYSVKKAKGKYTQFIDADDTINKEAIERLMSEAEKTDSDIVIAPFVLHKDNDQPIICNNNISKEELPNRAINLLFAGKIYPCVWSKFIKTNMFNHKIDKAGVFVGEDFVMSIQLLYHAKNISTIDYPTIDYYLTEDSGSHSSKFHKNVNDYIAYNKFVESFLLEKDLLRKIPEYLFYKEIVIRELTKNHYHKEVGDVIRGLNKLAKSKQIDTDCIHRKIRKMMKMHKYIPAICQLYIKHRLRFD